ncbi:hypothetical protein AB0J28_49055, partial [Streptosporangium canum]
RRNAMRLLTLVNDVLDFTSVDSGRTGGALLASAGVAALPVAVLLAVLAPWLLEHIAPSGTLNVLSVMILPFAPLMLGAQVWVWRTFGPRRAADRVPSFF